MGIWMSYAGHSKRSSYSRSLFPELLNNAIGIEEIIRLARHVRRVFLVHVTMLTAWEDPSTPKGDQETIVTFGCQWGRVNGCDAGRVITAINFLEEGA